MRGGGGGGCDDSFGQVVGGRPRRAAVKFFKNLAPGHIGVKANQQQALEYAVKYGFEGIAPDEGEFANKSAAEIGEWLETMKQKGIRYGPPGCRSSSAG